MENSFCIDILKSSSSFVSSGAAELFNFLGSQLGAGGRAGNFKFSAYHGGIPS